MQDLQNCSDWDEVQMVGQTEHPEKIKPEIQEVASGKHYQALLM